jgi:hypothetical protein
LPTSGGRHKIGLKLDANLPPKQIEQNRDAIAISHSVE